MRQRSILSKAFYLVSLYALFIYGITAALPPVTANAPPQFSPYFVGLQLGVNSSRLGQTQTLALFNSISNRYIKQTNTTQSVFVLATFGRRFFEQSPVTLSSSLAIGYIGDTTVKGEIWQFNNPAFNNINYQYKVNSQLYLLDNRLELNKCHFHPFVLFGFGFAINTANNYIGIAKRNTGAPMQVPFSDARQTQFAYELGAGFSRQFPLARIFVSYRFISTGHGQLGLTPLQNTNNHLQVGAIHYHVFSLGAEFGNEKM